MCDVIGKAQALSRRNFLAAAGTIAAVGTAGMAGARPAHADGTDNKPIRGDRVVLLGTGGGPVWWHARKGTSSAVVVGDRRYLVDCGEGVGSQYRAAGLGPEYPKMALGLEAIFLTHLHTDHTIDYNNMLLFGYTNGLALRDRKLQVYGPGDRGVLPEVFGPPPTAPLPIINPDRPTPGTVDMTASLIAAFAQDINTRIRDERRGDPRDLFDVHDIVVPAALHLDPNADPSPDMDPVPVYEDECVRVTAILNLHRPVFPSFAFRFDTDSGSVVFSGDTAPCRNVVRLARGADTLVHEVIDAAWVASLFPEPRTPAQQGLYLHLLGSHTTIEDVGKVAEQAGVDTLVLNHLVPGDNPPSRWRKAARGFSGRLVVGTDLMQLPLSRRRLRGGT